MKRILSLVLAAMMVATMLCACTAADPTKAPTNAPTNAPTQAPTQKPTTPATPTEPKPTEPAGQEGVINVNDFLNDRANWIFDNDEVAGELLTLADGKMHFDTNFPGDLVAAMLNKPQQNGSYKFTLTINGLAEGYADNWYETELIIITRASKAGTSWYDDLSQTGYTISAWGDMSTFCLGRCGYDDAFGEFEWNVNDGQPHEIEIITTNSEDNKTVEIVVLVDGAEVARATDDGSKIKKERPGLYPDAGNLVIRAKWMEITVG